MMLTKTRLFILTIMLMFSATAFGQSIRGFYLQDVGDWLGDASDENDILAYAQGNGFNYILFYDLGDIDWTNAAEKNKLAAFMSKARTQYGILQIGGVVEYAGYLSQLLLPYNNSRSNNNEKFDVINLEFEFWVNSSISNSYCSKFLNAAGYSCDTAGAWKFAWREFKKIDSICAANSMISEFYMGWPNKGQLQQIASRADRILLSAYRPTDNDIYLYSTNRMKDIASIGGTTKILTLMSSESSFMGSWLNSHPQTRPFQTMESALNAETASFKTHISLQGYQWFTYRYMPKTMLATASISASGPVTFCPGGSVTLTANSGSAYLWMPGGQTTRSITVSNAGSYTVRVTSNGTNATSSPTVVSNSGTGATPTVSLSGPVSFCPGGNVTLTSSSASSYHWSTGATTQSITVSSSGSYSVTTGSGGCSGTSSTVVVNAASAPTVPVVTASSSLNKCPGTVLTLTSTPANSYIWSNGATTRSIVVSAAGAYRVSAFSGPNCSALSATKTVTLLTAPATPTISANSSTTLTASHTSVILTSSVANAYEWSTTSTLRAITVTAQGAYRVTVTGSNGCKSTSNQVAVIANGCTPPAAPSISMSGTGIISSGQTVTLTSTISSGYRWSTGATTRTITVSSGGIYTVRSYNGGGCFSTSLPVTITVVPVREASNAVVQENTSDQFSVYPNPANDQLNIVFNQSEDKKITVKLFDVSGREIQSRDVASITGENHLQMDVSALPNGIYFACLLRDDQKQMIKVIVE